MCTISLYCLRNAAVCVCVSSATHVVKTERPHSRMVPHIHYILTDLSPAVALLYIHVILDCVYIIIVYRYVCACNVWLVMQACGCVNSGKVFILKCFMMCLVVLCRYFLSALSLVMCLVIFVHDFFLSAPLSFLSFSLFFSIHHRCISTCTYWGPGRNHSFVML